MAAAASHPPSVDYSRPFPGVPIGDRGPPQFPAGRLTNDLQPEEEDACWHLQADMAELEWFVGWGIMLAIEASCNIGSHSVVQFGFIDMAFYNFTCSQNYYLKNRYYHVIKMYYIVLRNYNSLRFPPSSCSSIYIENLFK